MGSTELSNIEIRHSGVDIFQTLVDLHQADVDAARQEGREDAYIHQFCVDYWQQCIDARNSGKKLVAISESFSPELIYAFDAVPVWMDVLAIEVGATPYADEIFDLAEKYVPATFCAIDRGIVGLLASGMLNDIAAVTYTTGPCDSFRQAYGICGDMLDVPCFGVDQPVRQDDRTYRYIAQQYKEVLELMEKVTGNKFDIEKLRAASRNSNLAATLLNALGKLRLTKPNPLAGGLMSVNEYGTGCFGSEMLVDFFLEEYRRGLENVNKGIGVTRGKEKHRALLVQNMVWNIAEILDWMEEELETTVVAGTMEILRTNLYDNTSLDTMLEGMAQRANRDPMVHNSGGYTDLWLKETVWMAKTYQCDCALYLGHVGCKHTWAASKMLSDILMRECGIKTLTLDVDSVDRRYQRVENVEADIREFIGTL